MQRDAANMMTAEPGAPFSTEIVTNGSTVEWLYLNLTADSHPFHTHLAHFEVMGRQPFDAIAYADALEEARASVPAGQRLDPRDLPRRGPVHDGARNGGPGSREGAPRHGHSQPGRYRAASR